MGVDQHPFFGFGYMLRKGDTTAGLYEAICGSLMEDFADDLELAKIIELWSDVYCGDWIFLGVAMHGDESEIKKVDAKAWINSNGDDIDLEAKKILGEHHPLFKHATFGTFFGMDYT